MRALFVNEGIGGHVSTHLHLARALATDHPDVEARFLTVPPPSVGRRVVGAAVPGLARLDLDLQPLRAQLAASAWTRRHLRAAAAGVDVVHVFTHNAVLLSARTLAGLPTVVGLDSTNEINGRSLPQREPTRFTPWTVAATRPFESRVYAAADRLVPTSAVVAASLVADYGVDPAKVRPGYYGIGAPSFDVAAAPGTTAARPRLVFVGRSLARKGGHQLLRVHREHLADRCDLVLVTPEPVPPAPGVTVLVDLRPGDPRLWDLLRSAAAFVLPSVIDQQPNAVLEAMAAGLPVIAHPVNALPEMVLDGVTGHLLADREDATLAAAVTTLLDAPTVRAAQGAAGRARFEQLFSAERTTAVLVDLLHEVRRAR